MRRLRREINRDRCCVCAVVERVGACATIDVAVQCRVIRKHEVIIVRIAVERECLCAAQVEGVVAAAAVQQFKVRESQRVAESR